jgi:hypothetical protein
LIGPPTVLSTIACRCTTGGSRWPAPERAPDPTSIAAARARNVSVRMRVSAPLFALQLSARGRRPHVRQLRLAKFWLEGVLPLLILLRSLNECRLVGMMHVLARFEPKLSYLRQLVARAATSGEAISLGPLLRGATFLRLSAAVPASSVSVVPSSGAHVALTSPCAR